MAVTPPPPCRRASDAACLETVVDLARRCRYEQAHTHQVTRLSLALFDELADLHGLGEDERFWLQCGAMLHDIGWCEGQKGHHKTALARILEAEGLALHGRDRLLVANIARYHRKALPRSAHGPFAALDAEDQRRVRVLAGILRVCDGLDRSHSGLVRRLACDVLPDRVVVRCEVVGPAAAEEWAAMRKADLFEDALGRKLTIDVGSVPV